ncbi:ZIP family metal transporter [Algihabitans albus]|uniref:ZIP family metal transporter n=1 Tax=Algihabitans albus TaxID=2164067 RepID=UPI000E5D05C3|nr:ZIP family metal transporter [Algihabitans albus]
MAGFDTFLLGTAASLVAGLGTGLGALAIFAVRRMTAALETLLMSMAAGIMLAASVLSLLLPAIEAAEPTAGATGAGLIASTAVLLGGGLFWLVHRYVPHEHFVKGREGRDSLEVRRLWLFVLAITIHNFPEGLAVGAGFGGDDPERSIALTLGILVQNMPEGFIVAAALVALGYRRRPAFLVALLTGLVEPVGGLLGAGAVAFVAPLLPWALAFAAGAMLFVIGGEMIPETHRRGFESRATFGLLIGFCLMVMIDQTI